ncbi:MAG: ribosome maturation factor RimP [Rhodospirillales bacterium]|nr:ribosome maturation factor RimP [Rhodospirillales bacterium]
MGNPAKIESLIAPTLEDMGFNIVRIEMMGQEGRILQIMAERKDEEAMTVENCAEISRAISAILEVEDPIAGAFTLEVSSPGLDRPLVSERDFERFSGKVAKIELSRPHEGQKRYKGCLDGIEDGIVKMNVGDDVVKVAFADISRAKLVITDDLLKATKQQGRKAGR